MAHADCGDSASILRASNTPERFAEPCAINNHHRLCVSVKATPKAQPITVVGATPIQPWYACPKPNSTADERTAPAIPNEGVVFQERILFGDVTALPRLSDEEMIGEATEMLGRYLVR